MKIYIITRFNIPFMQEHEKKCLDESYLDKRFSLFEKYTFPSIKNQTVQLFTWLVLFHEDTPEVYQYRIKKYTEYEKFVPLYGNQNTDISLMLKDYFRKELDNYITIRIDNDDAFHCSLVESIFKLDMKAGMVATFPIGIQYIEKWNAKGKFEYIMNHFLFMCSGPNSRGEHILQYDHSKIENFVTLTVYETKEPMWIEIIHDTNLLNPIRDSVKCVISYCNDLLEYGIKLEKQGFVEWFKYTKATFRVHLEVKINDLKANIKKNRYGKVIYNILKRRRY